MCLRLNLKKEGICQLVWPSNKVLSWFVTDRLDSLLWPPVSIKVVVCGHRLTFVTLPLTVNEVLKWL